MMNFDCVLTNQTFEDELRQMATFDDGLDRVRKQFMQLPWTQRMVTERKRLNRLMVSMKGRTYKLTIDHVNQAMRMGCEQNRFFGFDIQIVTDAEYVTEHFE